MSTLSTIRRQLRKPCNDRPTADAFTAAREAYFLDIAAELAQNSPIPLMLTGGITRYDTANRALTKGIDIVGIATAIAHNPDVPKLWTEGIDNWVQPRMATWKDKTLASAADNAMVRHQMHRIAGRRQPSRRTPAGYALFKDLHAQRKALSRYREWLATQPTDLETRYDRAGRRSGRVSGD